MKSFKEIFDRNNWDDVTSSISAKTSVDVEAALASSHRTLEDFKALISPAALPYLEQMAQLSHALTKKRFGNTIQLFAPMYLSNECHNICTYCGFSFDNKIKRKTLSAAEILQEVNAVKKHGFQHILSSCLMGGLQAPPRRKRSGGRFSNWTAFVEFWTGPSPQRARAAQQLRSRSHPFRFGWRIRF